MKQKIITLFILFVSFASLVSAETFFFTAETSGDINNRSNWAALSDVVYKGNSFSFYLYPTDAVTQYDSEKSNKYAGLINADQSSNIAPDSTVIFNRYSLGELQPDGSYAFNTFLNNANIQLTSDFTAGEGRARINNTMRYQFAGTGSITFSLSKLTLDYISNMYFEKQTATSANVNISGAFVVIGGNNLTFGSATSFMDTISVGTFNVGDSSDVNFKIYAQKVSADVSSFVKADDSKSATISAFVKKLDSTDALFSFGKTTKKNDSIITIDFSYADILNVEVGEYKIVSITSESSGFKESGSLADFSIKDDYLTANEIEHNFSWDGQNLILNIVPEPSSIAAIFGLLALCCAFVKRKYSK